MNLIKTRWPRENIERAVAILGQHERLHDALAHLTADLGFVVTRSGLDCALKREGLGTAASYLRGQVRAPRPAQAVPIPPITQRDTEVSIPVAQAVELPDDSETTAPKPAVPPPPPLSEAELLDLDLAQHRESAELKDLRATKKRLVKEVADREAQIALLKGLRSAGPMPPVLERKTVGAMQRQGVPVMLCSDWHVEEPVTLASVNGLNEYNLDIAEACIDRMAEAFAWLLHDARYDCREAIIALLGDLISGYIHEELLERNFLSPTQASLWLQERIEKMLRRIAADCPQLERIIVVCCDGNHGRTTNKTRVSTRTANSFEWLLYHTLAARMRDDHRFEFRIAESEWEFVDVYGATLAFTHGDSFQYGGGVGGISIPIRRGVARQFQGRRIAKFSMGHFHQQQDFGDIAINGSMIGYSPYAMHVHAPFEPRRQSWFLWDSRRGQALSAPIWL